jgi:hypothetical protein
MTTKAKATPSAKPKTTKSLTADQKRIIALEARIIALEDRLDTQNKENISLFGQILSGIGMTLGRQGQALHEKVFPPTYSLSLVTKEEDENEQTATLIVENDGSFSLLSRNAEGNRVPFPKQEVDLFPVAEFIKKNKLVAGKVYSVNIFREEGTK